MKPLKILSINDSYEGGGAELVFQKTAQLLREGGHKVHLFAEKAFPHPHWKDVFHYIFSLRLHRKLKKNIQSFSPQIVHIHNFYHNLSPALLYYLMRWKKKANFKVIMTVHDYHFLCANNGGICWKKHLPQICEDCRDRKYHHILLKQCDPRGFAVNTLKFLQHFISYKLFNFEKAIDCFIVPSEYLRQRLSSFCEKGKISVINNPVFDFDTQKKTIFTLAKSIKHNFESIYIGRLAPEKGLEHFINKDYNPKTFGKFAIVGSGEPHYIEKLKTLVKEKRFHQDVLFLGKKSHIETFALLSKADRLIFSSLWAENCPLSVLEARILGKEVFHYGLGSIKEMLSLDIKLLSENIYYTRLLKTIEQLQPSMAKDSTLQNMFPS